MKSLTFMLIVKPHPHAASSARNVRRAARTGHSGRRTGGGADRHNLAASRENWADSAPGWHGPCAESGAGFRPVLKLNGRNQPMQRAEKSIRVNAPADKVYQF